MLLADTAYSPPRAKSYITDGSTRLYFSHDGLSTGEWAAVKWVNWPRFKKIKSVVRGCGTGAPAVSIFGTGAKGLIVFEIESCTSALFLGLQSRQNTSNRYTLHAEHPALGVKILDVEVMAATADAEDEQRASGDPVGTATIHFESHGTTTEPP